MDNTTCQLVHGAPLYYTTFMNTSSLPRPVRNPISNGTRALRGIIITGFAIRIILLIAVVLHGGTSALMTSDSYGFLATAQNIVAGHGFSKSTAAPFTPDAHFPPIYPLLMAVSIALTRSLIPLVLLQITLSSLMPLVVFHIGEFLTDRKKVLLSAAGFMAFEPITVFWSLTPLTEVVSVFFLLVGIYFFLRLIRTWRGRDAASAGIWLALSTLTRPHAQFLFILGFLFLIIVSLRRHKGGEVVSENAVRPSGHGVRPAGRTSEAEQSMSESSVGIREGFQTRLPSIIIFTTVFCAVLTPWLVRNYKQFGTVSVASTGLRNVYSSIGASTLSLHTGEAVGDVRERLNREFAKKYHVSETDIKENPALGSALAREGITILREHPKETLEVLAIDGVAFFTQDLWADYLQRFGLMPGFSIDFSPSLVLLKQGPAALASLVWQKIGLAAVIPALGRLLWILVTLCACFGLWRAIRQDAASRTTAIVFTVIILYYAATSSIAGFSDQGRFRYPAHAFLFLLASYGLIRATKKSLPETETAPLRTPLETI